MFRLDILCRAIPVTQPLDLNGTMFMVNYSVVITPAETSDKDFITFGKYRERATSPHPLSLSLTFHKLFSHDAHVKDHENAMFFFHVVIT